MRSLGRFFCFLSLVLMTAPCWATKITVGDPAAAVAVNPITDNDLPFQVTFGSCTGLSGFSSNMGCFAFFNDTSSGWTSITLTLISGTPSGGFFTCASDTYAQLNCRNPMELVFTDGLIPNNNPLQTFVIAEDDLAPGSLSFRADVTFASATPEPSGLMLLGTGLLCTSALFWVRRRAEL